MASDEPIGGNIQHTAPTEHNTGAIPGATVGDVDGAVVPMLMAPRLTMLMASWLPTRMPCPLQPWITSNPSSLSVGA